MVPNQPEMPKVSLVIPAYNVAPYLSCCLNSVTGQTLEDIQIICVNDGSTDKSGDILKQFAAKDERIMVIQQRNGGLSSARNVGASVATGEYIYFLDSDDFISLTAMEKLYTCARERELDLLAFDAMAFFEDDSLRSQNAHYEAFYRRRQRYPDVMSGARLFTAMSVNDDYRTSVCLQFINNNYYRSAGLHFYEGIFHEDNLFSLMCFLQAKRALHIPEPYFHRRLRAGSIMTGPKGFAHFKGSMVCYLEMLRFVMRQSYDAATSSALAKVCMVVFDQARQELSGLSDEDRLAISEIDRTPEGQMIATLLLQMQERGRTNTSSSRRHSAIRRAYWLFMRAFR